MFPEDDPRALRKALARLIDPEGKRFITYIRLEASLHEPPRLTVREWVRPETLKDLEEIVRHYQLTPAPPPL